MVGQKCSNSRAPKTDVVWLSPAAPIVMKTGASSLVTGSSQKREERRQAHIKDKAEEEAPMPFNLVND